MMMHCPMASRHTPNDEPSSHFMLNLLECINTIYIIINSATHTNIGISSAFIHFMLKALRFSIVYALKTTFTVANATVNMANKDAAQSLSFYFLGAFFT